MACFELLTVKYLAKYFTNLFPKPDTAEVKTPQQHSSTTTFQLVFQESLQVAIVIKNKKSYFGYNKRKEGRWNYSLLLCLFAWPGTNDVIDRVDRRQQGFFCVSITGTSKDSVSTLQYVLLFWIRKLITLLLAVKIVEFSSPSTRSWQRERQKRVNKEDGRHRNGTIFVCL